MRLYIHAMTFGFVMWSHPSALVLHCVNITKYPSILLDAKPRGRRTAQSGNEPDAGVRDGVTAVATTETTATANACQSDGGVPPSTTGNAMPAINAAPTMKCRRNSMLTARQRHDSSRFARVYNYQRDSTQAAGSAPPRVLSRSKGVCPPCERRPRMQVGL